MGSQINAFLTEHNDYIIIGGFLIGFLYILSYIPADTKILNLGSNVKYLYLGIIGVAGYTYHKFFWGKLRKVPTYQKTVIPRVLKRPVSQAVQRKMAGDEGNQPVQKRDSDVTPGNPPSRKIFDKFSKNN